MICDDLDPCEAQLEGLKGWDDSDFDFVSPDGWGGEGALYAEYVYDDEAVREWQRQAAEGCAF